METKNRQSALAAIERLRISAIIRTTDECLARDAMAAAVDGGFRMIEFTLTTPNALNLVKEFSRSSDLIVGAGTVLAPAQARDAVNAGAQFLVSPIGDPAVVAECRALDVISIPGAFTPTEMETAHRWGADIIKLFPAPAGGVDFIRALRGPLPHLRIFPTAGPTPDNFLEYLEAGCFGVGFVRSLFDPADLSGRNFAAIRRRAADITNRLQIWQANKNFAPIGSDR